MQRGRSNKIVKSYKKRYTPLNVNREGYENMPDGRSKSSAVQYRPPQANQTLVMGEREAHKSTGDTVGAQFLQGMAKNMKETKDKVKGAVVGAVKKGLTGGIA